MKIALNPDNWGRKSHCFLFEFPNPVYQISVLKVESLLNPIVIFQPTESLLNPIVNISLLNPIVNNTHTKLINQFTMGFIRDNLLWI